jgi:hypothetical protein
MQGATPACARQWLHPRARYATRQPTVHVTGIGYHEARFDGRPAGAARGPQCFRFVYPRRGLLDR